MVKKTTPKTSKAVAASKASKRPRTRFAEGDLVPDIYKDVSVKGLVAALPKAPEATDSSYNTRGAQVPLTANRSSLEGQGLLGNLVSGATGRASENRYADSIGESRLKRAGNPQDGNYPMDAYANAPMTSGASAATASIGLPAGIRNSSNLGSAGMADSAPMNPQGNAAAGIQRQNSFSNADLKDDASMAKALTAGSALRMAGNLDANGNDMSRTQMFQGQLDQMRANKASEEAALNQRTAEGNARGDLAAAAWQGELDAKQALMDKWGQEDAIKKNPGVATQLGSLYASRGSNATAQEGLRVQERTAGVGNATQRRGQDVGLAARQLDNAGQLQNTYARNQGLMDVSGVQGQNAYDVQGLRNSGALDVARETSKGGVDAARTGHLQSGTKLQDAQTEKISYENSFEGRVAQGKQAMYQKFATDDPATAKQRVEDYYAPIIWAHEKQKYEANLAKQAAAKQPRPATGASGNYAEGGPVESPEQVMARMRAKYGLGAPSAAEPAAPIAAPLAQAPAPTQGSWTDKARGALGDWAKATRRDRQYADGDLVETSGEQVAGAGDGKSDSLPVMIDGQHPGRLSSGEFVMPVEAVQHFGLDKLRKMVAASRKGLDTGR